MCVIKTRLQTCGFSAAYFHSFFHSFAQLQYSKDNIAWIYIHTHTVFNVLIYNNVLRVKWKVRAVCLFFFYLLLFIPPFLAICICFFFSSFALSTLCFFVAIHLPNVRFSRHFFHRHTHNQSRAQHTQHSVEKSAYRTISSYIIWFELMRVYIQWNPHDFNFSSAHMEIYLFHQCIEKMGKSLCTQKKWIEPSVFACTFVFNWQKLSRLKGSRQVQRSFEWGKSTDMILTHILISNGAFGYCRHRHGICDDVDTIEKKTHIFSEETCEELLIIFKKIRRSFAWKMPALLLKHFIGSYRVHKGILCIFHFSLNFSTFFDAWSLFSRFYVIPSTCSGFQHFIIANWHFLSFYFFSVHFDQI